MGRLRQYLANRYSSVEATNTEFENIVRYINSAEIGNLTLSELMVKLFNDDGDVDLGVEFQFDSANGLQFRLDPDAPWTQIAAADLVRGPAGRDMGDIQGPLFFNRQDFTATNAQTVFPYTIDSSVADVMVMRNGLLLGQTGYTVNSATSQVTLANPATLNDLITIVSIRISPSTQYVRADLTAAANQVVFPFPLAEGDEIVVYRNGVLQREGGGYDFVKSWQTSTVTMTVGQPAGTLISILKIENENIGQVAGLMLEDSYTNGSGSILLSKVAINDGDIAQSKVNGLVAALAGKAPIYVQSGTPATPTTGSLWVNTSYSVPALMFFDGVRWLSASPNGLVPLPQNSDVLKFLRLNSTATALEFAALDLSSVVAKSSVGVQNGVASLDGNGLLPASQLPAWAARSPIIGRIGGSVANGTYPIGIVSDKFQVDALTVTLTSGTATVQLQVAGSSVGSTVAASSAITKLAITPTAIDGTGTPKLVSLVVSGAATPVDLTYNVSGMIVG